MSEIADRETKWQARWKEAGLGRAHREEGRPKYFIVFAYPGSSGFQHLGHMRGFTYADALARFHRMQGARVLFPGGTHASGLPSVTFAAKVEHGDPDTLQGLKGLGLNEEGIARLTSPEEAARFLGETYWQAWERFGLLMDRGAYLTTIDPDYRQFIRWQFARLEQGGYLVQKPYYAPFCPRSGPVSVDPSETDLSRGGSAEIITYTALPFTLDDGRVLLAATLRPETVYGATNVWLPPDGSLEEWKVQGRTYLASPAGVAKLLEQQGGERGGQVPIASLLGSTARAPLTGERLPLIASQLVNPAVGTGVVMSVPGHAPADWVAIGELPAADAERLRGATRTIIDVPSAGLAPSEQELLKGEGAPAGRAIANIGVQGLGDKVRLQEATERVYLLEFSHGVLSVGPFAGHPVARARTEVAQQAMATEGAVEIREFSEPVVCRCGETVIIRRIPDQWFLGYGSMDWKRETREAARRMHFEPREYGTELEKILDWFDDRPAMRQGKWLGTPFPRDPRWIIEPIADSTFYPAYYVVRRYVSDGRVSVDQLTEAFFDYVFLGRGAGEPSVDLTLLREIRQEFEYWYPLDLNLGGKEHKRVHFPVFLYNHVALLPPEKRPLGIFVHWWLTSYTGEKISKKDVKGGQLPPVDEALTLWGADAIRLYYAIGASPSQDIQWDREACAASGDRVEETLRQITALPPTPAAPIEKGALVAHVDRWFATRVVGLLQRVRESFEGYDLRTASQGAFVELPALIRRYRARGGDHPELLGAVADLWVRLIAPITPHIAEEAYRVRGGKGFVSVAGYPRGTELPAFPDSLERERVVEGVEEDVAALLKVWKKAPAKLRVFVAAPWKYHADARLRERLADGPLNIGRYMQEAKIDPALQPHMGDLPKFLQEVRNTGLSGLPPLLSPGDELATLQESATYLARRLEVPSVEVWTEDEGAPHDPANRRGRSRPGKPALALE